MKIHDISQEVFGSKTYPGDPTPEKQEVLRKKHGDKCNLTSFSMCCHNATHVDAPYHFIDRGKTVGEIPLEKFMGRCAVIDMEQRTLEEIENCLRNGIRKILLKGEFELTVETAERIAEAGIDLIGVENCTVGNEKTGPYIHEILLEKETVILEGILLRQIEEGEYFLCAQPVNLGQVDGAPCRAVLVEDISY